MPDEPSARDDDPRRGSDLFWRHALSSGAPAVLWAAVGCPFDVIKTRMQTATTAFSGPLRCLSWTLRHDGVAALWRGFWPQLLLTTPYSMIMFGTYRALRPSEEATTTDGSGGWWYLGGCVLAGAASGVAVTAVHHPLELWRVRVQTHIRGPSEEAPTNRSVLRGLRSRPWWNLGRGASMTLAENILGNAAFFGSHEAMMRHRVGRESELLVGGLTGVVFQIVVYPMDLVKARMMTSEGGTAGQIAHQLWRDHGPMGFYRGSSVAVARAFAINAAGWPALRVARVWLGLEA